MSEKLCQKLFAKIFLKIGPLLTYCFRYTCDECIQGLEWVEAYIEDPIMIAEYVVYLEQNFCQGAT